MTEPFFKYSYKRPSLEELNRRTDIYFEINGGTPKENDFEINQISSDIPCAMLQEYGECWLGKINLYSGDPLPFKLTRYKADGTVNLCNFSFDFCIPKHDTILEKMINDRATYTGRYSGVEDMKKIKAIFKRIEELKGMNLIWS